LNVNPDQWIVGYDLEAWLEQIVRTGNKSKPQLDDPNPLEPVAEPEISYSRGWTTKYI
jgi:hypothetical protein